MIPPEIVVDASVALKWLIPEPDTDKALALHQSRLFAPSFLLTECGNALWSRVQRGLMSEIEASEGLMELNGIPVTLAMLETLNNKALSLAMTLKHPIYDCLYLSLAMDLDIPLVTADQRFLKALQPHAPLAARVMHLADLP